MIYFYKDNQLELDEAPIAIFFTGATGEEIDGSLAAATLGAAAIRSRYFFLKLLLFLPSGFSHFTQSIRRNKQNPKALNGLL